MWLLCNVKKGGKIINDTFEECGCNGDHLGGEGLDDCGLVFKLRSEKKELRNDVSTIFLCTESPALPSKRWPGM